MLGFGYDLLHLAFVAITGAVDPVTTEVVARVPVRPPGSETAYGAELFSLPGNDMLMLPGTGMLMHRTRLKGGGRHAPHLSSLKSRWETKQSIIEKHYHPDGTCELCQYAGSLLSRTVFPSVRRRGASSSADVRNRRFGRTPLTSISRVLSGQSSHELGVRQAIAITYLAVSKNQQCAGMTTGDSEQVSSYSANHVTLRSV